MSKVRPAPPSVVGAKPPPIGVGVVGLPALSNPPPNPINPVSVFIYEIVDNLVHTLQNQIIVCFSLYLKKLLMFH